jgi:hypothetical protein
VTGIVSESLLIRPRFISFDSAHLGAAATDAAANDHARQKRARFLETAISDSGSVIVLSYHHIEELLSHQRDEVVQQRISYIQSLPMVAAVSSFRRDGLIGAITDIQSFEISAAFNNPLGELLAVRDEVAKNIFRLCSGADLLRPFLPHLAELRQHFSDRKLRNGEIIGISRSASAGNAGEKIVDLLKGQVRTPEGVKKQFERLHQNLADDLRTRGDKRIDNPEHSSAAFLDSVKRLGLQAVRGDNPARQILELSGIELSDIGPETTVGDVGNMAVFRKKLALLNEQMGFPWAALRERVPEERLPSGVISGAIARYHPDTKEWDGSELADRHLACLAAYADVTFVDKRTLEASRQAKQKSKPFASVIRSIERAADYVTIAEQLGRWAGTSNI